ncbi:MAG TPA: hypothetical protein VHS59_04115, partial [Bacillota bacterium]|nr:hypothetical protein [Bacillota bacterium]
MKKKLITTLMAGILAVTPLSAAFAGGSPWKAEDKPKPTVTTSTYKDEVKKADVKVDEVKDSVYRSTYGNKFGTVSGKVYKPIAVQTVKDSVYNILNSATPTTASADLVKLITSKRDLVSIAKAFQQIKTDLLKELKTAQTPEARQAVLKKLVDLKKLSWQLKQAVIKQLNQAKQDQLKAAKEL